MIDVFLNQPFGDPDLLDRLFGPAARGPMERSGTLADHAVRSDASGLRLTLVPWPGATAAGGLVGLDDAQQARLDFCMAALGAAPRPVRVAAAAGPVTARAYLRPAGTAGVAWSLADWGGEWRCHLLEAVGEIMAHFGRRAPAEMPGLMHGIGYRALARARGRQTATPVRLRSGLGAAEVTTLGLERPYAGFFGIEELRLKHRRFDGAMSEPLDRAVFTSGDAVTVLPFDPRRDKVLLIEQFRAGPVARRDPSAWMLEAVAGRCDALERPEDTARREAREEAGLELKRLERIAAYYSTPGVAAEYITAFVGEADLDGAGGTHGLAEEGEDIRTMVVPLADAVAAASDGEANNGPLLILLLWLARNAGRLRAAWD